MAESSERGFLSYLDYSFLAISLILPFCVAIWTAFRSKNTAQDFFTASKSMTPLPVAMSFLSTFISGYMIIAYAGEVYGYGLEYSLVVIGALFGIPTCTYTNLKVFYDLQITTVFEYLERRFNSFALRIFMSASESLKRLLSAGITLAGCSLVLSVATSFEINTCIVVIGSICGFYAAIGGMRGVIWTDFIMMIVMVTGLVAVIVVGCLKLGLSQIWNIAQVGGRTKFFNFNPSLFQRQNTYLVVAMGFLIYGKNYASDQLSLQRARSLSSFDEYKKVLVLCLFGIVVTHVLMFGSGLIAYSIYVGCDPLSAGKIEKLEQILPYLIMDKLGSIDGIAGIFLAAIVCAAISTLTSYMNVFGNLVYSDILLNFKYFQNVSDRTTLIFCKTITLLTALPSIGIAYIATKAKSIFPIVLVGFGVITGPGIGFFFLGLFLPSAKARGAVFGFILSSAILGWLAIGRIVYELEYETLPLTDNFCNSSTNMSHSGFFEYEAQSSSEVTANSTSTVPYSIYNVSNLFFNCFGPLISVVGGAIFSYILGPRNSESVPEELITPCIRKFYFKKKPRGNKRMYNAD